MQTLKRFFLSIWLRATSPRHYQTLLKKPFTSALGYLYWFLYTLSLVSGVAICLGLLALAPNLRTWIADIKTEAVMLYPRDLVITITPSGTLTTNQKEPTTIDPLTSWMKGAKFGPKDPLHLVTIDPAASIEDYPRYRSFLLVTKTMVIMPDKNQTYRLIPLSRLQLKHDLVITHAKADMVLAKALPYFDYLPGILSIGILLLLSIVPFIAAGVWLLGFLIYLFITSALLWLFALMIPSKPDYWQIYALSLSGLTLPILVSYPLSWFGLAFHFSFTVIFLVWMGVVLYKLKLTPHTN